MSFLLTLKSAMLSQLEKKKSSQYSNYPSEPIAKHREFLNLFLRRSTNSKSYPIFVLATNNLQQILRSAHLLTWELRMVQARVYINFPIFSL